MKPADMTGPSSPLTASQTPRALGISQGPAPADKTFETAEMPPNAEGKAQCFPCKRFTLAPRAQVRKCSGTQWKSACVAESWSPPQKPLPQGRLAVTAGASSGSPKEARSSDRSYSPSWMFLPPDWASAALPLPRLLPLRSQTPLVKPHKLTLNKIPCGQDSENGWLQS